jgi:hypothetical protein
LCEKSNTSLNRRGGVEKERWQGLGIEWKEGPVRGEGKEGSELERWRGRVPIK